MMRLRRPAPFSTRSRDSTCVLSSSLTPCTSAAVTPNAPSASSAPSKSLCIGPPLEAVFDPRRAKHGACAPRGMALHVDRDRIHRDMRRRGFHVHGERRRIAAEALRADAEGVHGCGKLLLEL